MVWNGSNIYQKGLEGRTSNHYDEPFKPKSADEIQNIAKLRIETILSEVRATKEEQATGWNSRGLS